MSVPILVTGAVIIACDILLTVLLLLRIHSCKKLMTSQQTVLGRVEAIEESHNANGAWLSFWVHYTVDGTEYRRRFMCRLGMYQDQQEVELVYLADRPKFSCVRDELRSMTLRNLRAVVIVLNVGFLFAFLLLLCRNSPVFRDMQDLLFCVFEMGAAWFWYLEEYRLANQSVTTQGTVVYAKQSQKRQIVIAEYTVDAERHTTRPMKLPMKRCEKTYTAGDAVTVRYREKKPDAAMLADDKYSLKAARVFLIGSVIYAIFIAVIYFLPF